MIQIIRISDVCLYNNKHYGLIFSDGSNVKKYCKDNNIEYFECYSNRKINIDMEKIKNDKINLMEDCDMYGDCKETIIYDFDCEVTLNKIKENMKSIPSRYEENKYCNVELFEKTKHLLNGSVVYEFSYNKIVDNMEDITDMFYNKVLVITNIPIITYC